MEGRLQLDTDRIGERERGARRHGDHVDDIADGDTSPMRFIHAAIGKRYRKCRFETFEVTTTAQRAALDACKAYAADFCRHVREGHSLVLIGPKGAGKDHLLCATLTAIVEGYRVPAGRIIYRDGLRLFAEFREAIGSGAKSENAIVDSYVRPDLFAVSDPVPPTGPLSDYEQRMWLRIVDGRYREERAMAATINASSRAKMDERMGSQAADRLCDAATVVVCNWDTHRKAAKVNA